MNWLKNEELIEEFNVKIEPNMVKVKINSGWG